MAAVSNREEGVERKPLTAERLRSLLHYDPETGAFTRRRSVQGFHANTTAGVLHKASGYIIVGVDRRRYRAHRLAWLCMTGEWPSEVDHRNGDRADNRWENLREATRSQNNANQKRRHDNSSGVKGVSWDTLNRRWRAYINGKQIGRFDSIDEAAAARAAAARALYGEFARA